MSAYQGLNFCIRAMQAGKKPATAKMLAIPGMPATTERHAKDASISRKKRPMIAKAKTIMYLMNPATARMPSDLGMLQQGSVAEAETTVPEFIDPVFTKTSPKRSFSLNRKRAFWLVFAKTGSIISGTRNAKDMLKDSLTTSISRTQASAGILSKLKVMRAAAEGIPASAEIPARARGQQQREPLQP